MPVASKPPRLRWIKGGDRDNAGRATMAPDMLRWRGLELAGTRATHAALSCIEAFRAPRRRDVWCLQGTGLRPLRRTCRPQEQRLEDHASEQVLWEAGSRRCPPWRRESRRERSERAFRLPSALRRLMSVCLWAHYQRAAGNDRRGGRLQPVGRLSYNSCSHAASPHTMVAWPSDPILRVVRDAMANVTRLPG